MLTVNLQTIPNQKVTFFADGQQYVLKLRTIGDATYADINMNGVDVITSCVCLPDQLINPFPYLEGEGGNFLFTTASGNNPQYQNFGAGDVLLYASNAELASARGG